MKIDEQDTKPSKLCQFLCVSLRRITAYHMEPCSRCVCVCVCVPSWSACWQQPSHAQISVRTKIAFFGAHLPGLDLYIAKF